VVKFIITVKRKPGMSQKEFAKYWKEVHGPKVRDNVPGLIKYIQNHRLEVNDDESTYDGIAEMYFEDMTAFDRQNKWFLSDAGRVIRDDEINFLDRTKMVAYLCEEIVIK
jgi:uncharacterized protein (TIGR02118 family)